MFQKLLAVLAISAFEFHSNFFGNKKPFAKLDEEQLQKIEDALAEKDTSALEKTIAEQANTITGLTTSATEIESAVNQALQLNGIDELGEDTTIGEAIAALGAKCKEYGDATSTHTIVDTDGKEKPDENGLVDNWYDPNAEHNQMLNKI
jgi:hypothetical protein